MKTFTTVDTFEITGKGLVHSVEAEPDFNKYLSLKDEIIILDGIKVKVISEECYAINPRQYVMQGHRSFIVEPEANQEGDNNPDCIYDFDAKYENMINIADSMARNFQDLAKEYWKQKQEIKTLRQQLEQNKSEQNNNPTA